jgi:hypothetical protein
VAKNEGHACGLPSTWPVSVVNSITNDNLLFELPPQPVSSMG